MAEKMSTRRRTSQKPPRARGEQAQEVVPETTDLKVLRDAVEHCRACPLGEPATHAVFGEGKRSAELLVIGEQPGDQEDLAGKPFVGPAGRVLDRALEEAGIERKRVFVTNAVKHFSFRPLGKKRLHQRPAWSNVVACRPWLRAEIASIQPQVIVCLGATAAQTLLGKDVGIAQTRGRSVESEWAKALFVTYHPSATLRGPDKEARDAIYAALLADLKLARRALNRLAPTPPPPTKK